MPIDYDPIAPPDQFDALRELQLPVDMLRWAPAWMTLRSRRAEHPRTVILLPGFGASPRSMRLLESFLRRHGHRVRDWGLGRNTGEVARFRDGLKQVVRDSVAAHGEPVVLVGWSLGGYIAREYAREHPDEVRKVITFGTPVIGGPRYTSTAARYRAQGHDLEEVERAVKDRYRVPLRVPVVAIYSKRDGIVAWQACIDRWSPNVRHVEVRETHIGMAFAPRVLGIVAEEVERG